jgi:plastocyanin
MEVWTPALCATGKALLGMPIGMSTEHKRSGEVMRIDGWLRLPRACGALRSVVSVCSRRRALATAVLATSALLVAASSEAQQAGPFDSMAGTWSGNGIVNLREGAKERVRCKSNYVVKSGGYNVQLDLVCASDAYKFDMSSNIVMQGDTLVGIWNESTHRVAGKIVGQANGGQIEVRAEGDTFTAMLSVTTHGDKQSLVMSSPGSKVESVTIALNRSK